ncbi:MAG: TonB-dependent receptor [Gammaproteobacteria bacterium]|nr:TonB-dependent receptor [Gammaproteobacteria bacterium]
MNHPCIARGRRRPPIVRTAVLAILGAAVANAAQAEEPAPASDEIIEEIVVVGHPLSGQGLALPSTVLTAEDLESKAADTIGATVGNEPGIHNSSFGAAAGRPIIHGLGGARVRVMEDRIDTLDVSVTSGDHAVTVDPFIAERVEVLKGSATLLYGSGAIGGVVDVHTGRIPHEVPERVHGAVDLRGSDNGDGRNGSFRLDGGGGGMAWHIDGFAREADDYEIPGFVESAALRALADEEEMHHDEDEELGEDDHDEDEAEGEDHDEDEGEDHEEEEEGHDDEDEEEVRGRLPGSSFEVRGGSVGFSFVGDRGFIGLSVSGLKSEYGIPGHAHGHGDEDHGDEEFGHGDEDEDEDHADDEDEDHGDEDEDEDHEEEEGDHEDEEGHGDEAEGTPVADLEQTRIDLEAALANPFEGFESINLRVGINDYEHLEIEPSGEVGTAFENDAWEARMELTHAPAGGWRGTLGAQFGDRQFSVLGEEAFTPPVDTQSAGLFWVGERSVGDLGVEAGLRYDRVEHDPAHGQSRDFNGASASLGLIIPLGNSWEATLLADYSSRAPVGEELFSDGPHFATRSFEIGDPGLDTEQARNLAATLNGGGDRWSARGTFYYTDFADFIYQAATGEEEDDLEVRQFAQADATFAGFEVEGRVTVAEWGGGRLELGAFFDMVSPELDVSGNDNLPLIPPDRVGVSVAFRNDRLRANVDYVRASDQDDVAEFELPTDGYDDLRARIAWRFRPGDMSLDLFIAGRNLTDDEQRLHTSIVKDLAPQRGRTVEAGMRMRF